MKKLILGIGVATIFAISSAFAPVTSNNNAVISKHVQGDICFSVKNDMGETVTLHTGTGTTTMNNGTKREFCIKEGLKLSIADKGRPGKTLLVVSQDISGKTFNLSKLPL
jgi:phosphotransferase system IIA component